jgi:hypothetical protein
LLLALIGLKEANMDEKLFTRIRDWVEPAHPAMIKQFEDLVSIYRIIRKTVQQKIDAAMDQVSRQIGFVVTTTIPTTLDISKEKVQWSVPEAIRGSLFEKAILDAVGASRAGEWEGVTPATYKLYLLWYDALKLKLRKDWLEPVHYLRPEVLERISDVMRVRPEVQEPAHWFHPATTIPVEDQIVISAIDEVYPELRLAERVSMTRQLLRSVRPDVMEPAHFRPGITADLVLRDIAQLLRRVRPDVMEPAHFRPVDRDILKELEALVRRYGS